MLWWGGNLDGSGEEEADRGRGLTARGAHDIERGPRGNELEAELEALYHQRRGAFVAFFRRSGMSQSVAEDLTQETFVAALVNIGQFMRGSQLFTWTYRIGINVLKGHLRAAARREDPAGNADEVHALATDIRLTEAADVPLSIRRRRDCIRERFAHFAREHPERAMVLSMAEWDGWRIDDIARWIGRSPGATRQYLSQSRKLLRDLLAPCREH